MWDHDTDVPLRMWGSTSPIPGSVANAQIAEAAARAFLVEHLGLLAPGAKPGDFELVSNVVSKGIRSVGFVQRVNGMRVVGGSIGFAFKADRMALVSSTALPHASAVQPPARLAPDALVEATQRWLRTDGHEVTVAPVDLVVIPIVRPRVGAAPDITYRVAEQVSARATGSEGAWQVWIDASSAAPIARQTTISYVTGKLMFDVPVRYPAGMRSPMAAALASLTIDGTAATTAADGSVTWTGAGSATVRPKGTIVNVTTSGTAATTTMTLTSGGNATWSLATSETGDAQLSAYVHANIAKAFTKARLNPNLAWLDQALTVSVNESGGCNAFSTGDDIHFLRKNTQCENTARLADVVYHEFGHSLHNHSIIEGVGSWDSALSEGLGDILAMLITRDSGMARGFFLNNVTAPMRDLNPPNKEKKWGVDTTGEPHDDGEIIGGTFWDMYMSLETAMGQAAALDRAADIYYTIMQRASDIPSSYAEALLGDDDDGNLSNGTPNQCAIHAAFKLHNLASGTPPAGTVDKPVRTGFNISVKAQTGGGNTACPTPAVTAGEITWRLRGGTDAKVTMAMVADKFEGAIPSQPNGSVVQYKVTLTLSDGQKVSYPNNAADPYYEMYVGPVDPIWCASFENGAGDWTTSMDWEAGPAAGLGGDPKMAAGGSNVFGMDLSKDGAYAASSTSFAESPEIDLMGKTGVRLQMQRWLGVEDGFFDKAKLSVNGVEVWKNFASPTEPQQAGVNHVDREWRFADFDLAAQQASGKVKLRFELTSDQGLQMGGWTLDDVCIVIPAQGGGGDPNCGNGAVDTGEQCDDGNLTAGDGCNALCENETGGPGGEEPGTDDAGCCSVGGGPEGALALSLFTLGLVLRRRRRR